MSVVLRKYGPLGITLGVGFFLIFDYFLALPTSLDSFAKELINWGVVVTAFAMTVGTINLTLHHGKRIMKKNKDWYYSTILVGMLWIFIITGVGLGQSNTSYKFLTNSFYSPLTATMYASILPFMATACLRAFRARNRTGAILLIAGGLVMIGNTSIIELIFPFMPSLKEWIMTVPNMAAYRGMTIGAGLGNLLLGIRTLLGYERGYMGSGD